MLPNFLILGAAKAGTSSLCEYLKTHPQIYMSPIKEPNFFALDGTEPQFPSEDMRRSLDGTITHDLASYERLFERARDETARGEGSSWYLHSRKAPERIQHYIPRTRMIVILRNPVERAYSAYRMHRRLGTEQAPTFAQALAEQERRRNTWDWGTEYLEPGYYHRHLSRYFERFRREQIRVYLHEDYSADPAGIVRDVLQFLEVDPSFVPPNLAVRYNTAENSPRPAGALAGILRRLTGRGAALASAPAATPSRASDVAEEIRAELIGLYREDIGKLQSLIARDLRSWLV